MLPRMVKVGNVAMLLLIVAKVVGEKGFKSWLGRRASQGRGLQELDRVGIA